ncbi:hypothetical protein [Xanthomonas phage RTH11]|nr:hypothetical protein [Xanthomonas phage RTH11]
MSFLRVALTPAELRAYKPALPQALSSSIPKPLIEKIKGTGHVTPDFAFAVAVDLLGLEYVTKSVTATPTLLATWVGLIESQGWGDNLRPMDLQISLLANAIKANAKLSNPPDDLRLEGIIYNLIVEAAKGDQSVNDQLVENLISGKGMTMPWALVIRAVKA